MPERELQAADVEELGEELLLRCLADECGPLRRAPRDVSLSAWLTGIARNLLRESSRASRARRTEALGERDPAAPDGDTSAGAAGPERPRVPLERLTPRQRQVMELLLAGRSERQVADRLGTSRDNVHELKRRAILRLRSGAAWTPPRELPSRWWAVFHGAASKRPDDAVSRRVVALHAQGLTRREIASRTGLSMKAVKERIARRRPKT